MLLHTRKIILCLLLSISAGVLSAQLIDNSSSFRNISATNYLRFNYENDFFTSTDYYYSQGITVEYVNPCLKKNPINRLLLFSQHDKSKYGISFNIFGYTPTTIESDEVLFNDRPFQANMAVKSFVVNIDSSKRQRIASSISVGIMGPAALGKEIQTFIHKQTGDAIPKGWQHQIKNDIILNYQLNYEKQILKAGNNLLLNGIAEAKAGTLHNKLSSGINFMAGSFSDPYSFSPTKKKVNFYLYGQGLVSFVGYDATMQGGLFNRKSVHTISSNEIERLVFRADMGIMLNIKKVYLSYSQSYLSKEFKKGLNHSWGGLSLAVSF